MSFRMAWQAGEPFEARDCDLHRELGVPAGTRGFVCYVDTSGISFYLDHGGYGLELFAPAEVFGRYFERGSGSIHQAYVGHSHFSKLYPNSLR